MCTDIDHLLIFQAEDEKLNATKRLLSAIDARNRVIIVFGQAEKMTRMTVL